jgi:proline dehydrogenase
VTRAGAPAEIPERVLRSVLLTLSRRRWLGRFAMRTPLARDMVGRFVAGETLDEALPALERLQGAGFATTVDVLGESVTSADDARSAAESYLETLDALAERDLDRNVSLKLSQMGLDIDEDLCRRNVHRIVTHATEVGAFVRIDMEDHSTVDRALAIWRDVRPPVATRASVDLGVVIQSALRRSPADVEMLVAEGARVRLCKGAYKEPAAVAHLERTEIDAAFRAIADRLLVDGAFPAIATHDAALIRHVQRFAVDHGIGQDRFEFQMLFGVRRDLQERLLAMGYRVRVYVPFGRQWYPYFMRRLAERPANVAFLARTVIREGLGRRGRR